MASRQVPGFHPSFMKRDRGTEDTESLKAQGFYHKSAWRRIRKQALIRDHYLCQECLRRGKITEATEVHHIRDLESFPSLGLELSNLESLCWQCHEDTKHRKQIPKISGVKLIRIADGVDEGFDIDGADGDPLA